MTIFVLLALLLTTPVAADGPDDGVKNAKKDDGTKTKKVEASPPATDYATKNLVGARGQVWISGGYGYTERYFDDDNDLQDLGAFSVPGVGGADTDARLTSYILHVGGSYDVSQLGDMNISVGADLGLAQREATADAIPGLSAERDASSGLAPQNLTLFGKISRPSYTLRAGYLLDFGPEEEDEDDFESTDRQDAVLLGISAQYPATNDIRVFGGLDYFLTLKGEGDFDVGAGPAERTLEDVEYDEGDLAVLNFGAGYNFGAGEIGVALLYRINTEGEFGDTDGDDVGTIFGDNPADPSDDGPRSPGTPNQFAGGSSLGFVPYVTYTPVGANFQVVLKGALQTEYHDYGYTFAGKNDIAPRVGFTLGVTYGI